MQTVLITGANRGIGLELVKQYAEAGWQVLACCRQPDIANALRQLAEVASNDIEIFSLNVTDINSMQALKKSIGDQPIDVLINNAGILGEIGKANLGKLYETGDEALHLFQVNALGPLFLSELLVDNVAKSALKTIANITSILGSVTLNNTAEYCLYKASKAALNSITASLAATLKPRQIKLIALHPGWVQTDMGGPSAPLPINESVKGIISQIKKLDLKRTGCYVQHSGETLPW
ncbi:MAG: short chain dehydrogenase [Gammaproteobacteria bacterium]|jgi:NAD(P)-dependent dehydrogenase (short-subunit alcohol dehydrogenase family)|nr:short chain dehydrogenase [Gammaproteobacteria bacterium]